jgi:hypothetical protein
MNVELPEKRYYSIGEVSKAFNVNASLIRFGKKNSRLLVLKKVQMVNEDTPLTIL